MRVPVLIAIFFVGAGCQPAVQKVELEPGKPVKGMVKISASQVLLKAVEEFHPVQVSFDRAPFNTPNLYAKARLLCFSRPSKDVYRKIKTVMARVEQYDLEFAPSTAEVLHYGERGGHGTMIFQAGLPLAFSGKAPSGTTCFLVIIERA